MRGSSPAWKLYRICQPCYTFVLCDTVESNDVYNQMSICAHSNIGRVVQFLNATVTHIWQCSGRVFQTQRRQSIISGNSPQTWMKLYCLAHWPFFSNVSAILFSAWASPSFEVVVHEVFYFSFEYFLHVCGHGQEPAHQNTAHIPSITTTLCVCDDAQHGCDMPKCYSNKPCCNNSEVLGIKRPVPGNFKGSPASSKEGSFCMHV